MGSYELNNEINNQKLYEFLNQDENSVIIGKQSGSQFGVVFFPIYVKHNDILYNPIIHLYNVEQQIIIRPKDDKQNTYNPYMQIALSSCDDITQKVLELLDKQLEKAIQEALKNQTIQNAFKPRKIPSDVNKFKIKNILNKSYKHPDTEEIIERISPVLRIDFILNKDGKTFKYNIFDKDSIIKINNKKQYKLALVDGKPIDVTNLTEYINKGSRYWIDILPRLSVKISQEKNIMVKLKAREFFVKKPPAGYGTAERLIDVIPCENHYTTEEKKEETSDDDDFCD